VPVTFKISWWVYSIVLSSQILCSCSMPVLRGLTIVIMSPLSDTYNL
jgi:hypothetical protein